MTFVAVLIVLVAASLLGSLWAAASIASMSEGRHELKASPDEEGNAAENNRGPSTR